MKERRSLQEQVGIDMSSSRLRIEGAHPGDETPLVRIAALGAAAMHIAHGVDRQRGRIRPGPIAAAGEAHQGKPIDVLAGELAAIMYHVRFGGQYELVPYAVALFASYLGMRSRFGRAGVLRDLKAGQRRAFLHRFAGLVLHEALSDRCVACGGSGKLERTESGSWVRPRGNMKRNAIYGKCTSCAATGASRPSHTARRKALGMTFEQYEAGHWASNFKAAHAWLLVDITRRLRRPLQIQLERVTKRA